jgi:hypothetical protein
MKIVGQCEISHPVLRTPAVRVSDGGPGQEDPDSMGELLVQKRNVLFDADGKETAVGLPSQISSESFVVLDRVVSYMHECSGIYYINAYGNEIRPYPNPDFLMNLSVRRVLVYSCGSLWTRSVMLGQLGNPAG